MLDKEQVNRAVQRLHQAEKSREQIRALSLDHPGSPSKTPMPFSGSGWS